MNCPVNFTEGVKVTKIIFRDYIGPLYSKYNLDLKINNENNNSTSYAIIFVKFLKIKICLIITFVTYIYIDI